MQMVPHSPVMMSELVVGIVDDDRPAVSWFVVALHVAVEFKYQNAVINDDPGVRVHSRQGAKVYSLARTRQLDHFAAMLAH